MTRRRTERDQRVYDCTCSWCRRIVARRLDAMRVWNAWTAVLFVFVVERETIGGWQ